MSGSDIVERMDVWYLSKIESILEMVRTVPVDKSTNNDVFPEYVLSNSRMKILENFIAEEPELIEFDVEVPNVEEPDGEERPDSPNEETSEGMNAPEVDDESSESEEEDEEKHKEKSLAEVIKGWANKKRRLDMKERMFGEDIERNRKRRKIEEEKSRPNEGPSDGNSCLKDGKLCTENPSETAPAPVQTTQPTAEQQPETQPAAGPPSSNLLPVSVNQLLQPENSCHSVGSFDSQSIDLPGFSSSSTPTHHLGDHSGTPGPGHASFPLPAHINPDAGQSSDGSSTQTSGSCEQSGASSEHGSEDMKTEKKEEEEKEGEDNEEEDGESEGTSGTSGTHKPKSPHDKDRDDGGAAGSGGSSGTGASSSRQGSGNTVDTSQNTEQISKPSGTATPVRTGKTAALVKFPGPVLGDSSKQVPKPIIEVVDIKVDRSDNSEILSEALPSKSRLETLEPFVTEEPEPINLFNKIPLAKEPDGEKEPDSPKEETSVGKKDPATGGVSSESDDEDEKKQGENKKKQGDDKNKEDDKNPTAGSQPDASKSRAVKRRPIREHEQDIENQRKRRKLEEQKNTPETGPSDGSCVSRILHGPSNTVQPDQQATVSNSIDGAGDPPPDAPPPDAPPASAAPAATPAPAASNNPAGNVSDVVHSESEPSVEEIMVPYGTSNTTPGIPRPPPPTVNKLVGGMDSNKK